MLIVKLLFGIILFCVLFSCSPSFTITSAYPTYMCSGQQIQINFECEYVRSLKMFGKSDLLLAEKTGMDDDGYTGSIITDNPIFPDMLNPKENTTGGYTIKGVGYRKTKSESFDYEVYFLDESNPSIMSSKPNRYDVGIPYTMDEEEKGGTDVWRNTYVKINTAWWDIDPLLFTGCVRINKIKNNSSFQFILFGVPLKIEKNMQSQSEIVNIRDHDNNINDLIFDTNPGGVWQAQMQTDCQFKIKKVKLTPKYEHGVFVKWEESANSHTYEPYLDINLDFYLLGGL